MHVLLMATLLLRQKKKATSEEIIHLHGCLQKAKRIGRLENLKLKQSYRQEKEHGLLYGYYQPTIPLHWPDDGELDIMEEVGFDPNVIHGTVHNKLYNGANGQQKGASITVPDAQIAYHVYSLEWSPNRISWAVDGINYFTYNAINYSAEAWPYNKDFFIILNTAVGGNWGGQQGVDDSVFPQQMLIDYVRIYQRK